MAKSDCLHFIEQSLTIFSRTQNKNKVAPAQSWKKASDALEWCVMPHDFIMELILQFHFSDLPLGSMAHASVYFLGVYFVMHPPVNRLDCS
ncbi:hypothetical protein CEXT_217431 [Caerostris extrusa]|uniref:Uncharacterized protein n=1 Tax=Caerostris extrusa TaxID=172846 RepID=A0AAV4X808_CAEEX|nr:hypothetical protein CEXT_217431 [Caerostris extrusa]